MLKIDRSFVRRPVPGERTTAPCCCAASSTSVGPCGLQVVAEGVDTEEQRQSLRAMGCPLGQGFLFAPPLSGRGRAADAHRRLASEPA